MFSLEYICPSHFQLPVQVQFTSGSGQGVPMCSLFSSETHSFSLCVCHGGWEGLEENIKQTFINFVRVDYIKMTVICSVYNVEPCTKGV
jgi:hypothetical protein